MNKQLDKYQIKALEQLWKQYNRLLFSLADAYSPSPDDADDIVHDVVLRLTNQIDRLMTMETSEIKRYLARAIHNEAISHGRNRKRQQQHFLPLDTETVNSISDTANTEEEFLQKDEIRQILTLIGELSPKEQTALRMKRLEHASNEEIAIALGLAESSVNQYVKRAQEKLLILYRKKDQL